MRSVGPPRARGLGLHASVERTSAENAWTRDHSGLSDGSALIVLTKNKSTSSFSLVRYTRHTRGMLLVLGR